MNDATAAMNDATSGEQVRNRPKLLPEERPPRRNRLDDLLRRPFVDGADPILFGEALAAEGAIGVRQRLASWAWRGSSSVPATVTVMSQTATCRESGMASRVRTSLGCIRATNRLHQRNKKGKALGLPFVFVQVRWSDQNL
jgi:hypothetical protein